MKKSVVTNKSAKGGANRSPNSASSAASKEGGLHKADADSSTSDALSKCPNLKIARKPNTDCVIVQFGTEYIKQLMAFSCMQLVPFRYYGLGEATGPKERQYPRAYKEEIMIWGLTSSDDKSGGRSRPQDWSILSFEETLQRLYKDADLPGNTIDPSCRLSDVLVVHKRDFTKKVIGAFKNGDLICRNELTEQSLYARNTKDYKKVSLLPYPLLCIYFKNEAFSKEGYPRLLQVLFTALLNKNLLKQNCPLEVVAREGFGSCIPSVSDVGTGIRLDPGLLPPFCVGIVLETLDQLGQFLRDKELMSKAVENVRQKLDGFGQSQLAYVDTLMEALAKTNMEQPKMVWEALKSPTKVGGTLPKRFEKDGKFLPIKSFEIEVCKMLPSLPPSQSSVLVDDDEPEFGDASRFGSGYGSESEGEFDDGSEGKSVENFVIKKAAFISGMAGINIIEAIGATYIEQLIDVEKIGPNMKPAAVFAAYFEAQLKGLGKRSGISHFDAAPHPTNEAGPGQLPGIGEHVISTIDVTNITTAEKCDYICRHIKACQGDGDKFNLLILEESASKHPTGGDLVYGVVRIIGRRDAVNTFYDLLQVAFEKDKEKGTSVLNPQEHQMRHLFQDLSLMPRDRDFVAYVNNTYKK